MADIHAVTGESVGEAICKALGIDYSTVQRVVLDLECGPGVGKVYIQHVTTENLLKYDWKAFCDGADVEII